MADQERACFAARYGCRHPRNAPKTHGCKLLPLAEKEPRRAGGRGFEAKMASSPYPVVFSETVGDANSAQEQTATAPATWKPYPTKLQYVRVLCAREATVCCFVLLCSAREFGGSLFGWRTDGLGSGVPGSGMDLPMV